MINEIINFYTDNAAVKFLCWGPVVINAMIYPAYVWKRVQDDRKAAEKAKTERYSYFSNFVTVGDLFRYFLLTVIPVLNALALIFHAGPIAWEIISSRLGWLFDLTLVKKPQKAD